MNDEIATKFNIRDPQGKYLCPVCGFPRFSQAPYSIQEGGIIGSGICFSCLWEPGFDDNCYASPQAHETILQSIKAYRTKWNREWRGEPNLRPQDWDAKKQLDVLFQMAPYVS